MISTERGRHAVKPAHRAKIPTIEDLDELAALVERTRDGNLYVRWSKGPDADVTANHKPEQSSRDGLTGIMLPGLSANPLGVEPWWGERPLRLWVTRRLFDYRHLGTVRGAAVRAWVLVGEHCGRGPDNEPLVICHQPVAWISEKTLRQAEKAVHEHAADEWGPLNRENQGR
jgi:hypothetical protein